MTTMAQPRLNPQLLQLPLYVAGKSAEEVKEALGLTEVIKLASNESPIGPSPLAVQAAQQALATAHTYPGVADRELRRKLAARLGHGLTADNLLLGNGGTDVLRLVTQAFVFDGGNAVMNQVTFPMYRILTTAFGGEVRAVRPLPDYRHDLEGMAAAIDDDTRLVFLCSPNNPTGDVISQAQLDRFLTAVPPHVVVLLDESYCDYVSDPAYADALPQVATGRPLLLARSFSKSAGLANMRVGYLVGPTELVSYVSRARLPFHVGDVALAAAAASLDDADYHERGRQVVLAGRDYLWQQLSRLGLCVLPSQANFVTLIDPPLPALELTDQLARRGLIVRPLAGFGLPNAIRITVGPMAANEKVVRAIKEIMNYEL